MQGFLMTFEKQENLQISTQNFESKMVYLSSLLFTSTNLIFPSANKLEIQTHVVYLRVLFNFMCCFMKKKWERQVFRNLIQFFLHDNRILSLPGDNGSFVTTEQQ